MPRLLGVLFSGAALAISGYWAMVIWGVGGGGPGGTDLSHHEFVVLYAISLGSAVLFAVVFVVATVRLVRAVDRRRRPKPLHTISSVSGERPTAAYLTGAVHRDELPILLVIREDDGDWQFLDGGFVNEENAVAVHIGHVFEKHPDLRSLADLPKGWAAERDSVTDGWRRYPWPSE